jgi:hypothetical protein
VCPLAEMDVALFPRKLLGDPLLSSKGVKISPKGAVDCLPLSWEGRGNIFKEAVGGPVPQQGGGVNQSQGSSCLCAP